MGMTIWLLALVLLASLAGLGLRQGAIRVAFSMVGIFMGVLLAAPLGRLIKPLLLLFGLKNPVLVATVSPLIGFAIVSALFKVAAFAAHHKVDVHFKYRAGDLRLALWERVHHRLGLVLGLFNGTLYFILISWVIYGLSYWTYQTATTDSEPTTLRVLNRLGQDLHHSGFSRVDRAIDPLPESYYDTADVAGLIYNNSLLEARLSRYPAFLGLAERPEFQDIASDTQFTEMRQKREPIMNLLSYPKTKAILDNPDLMKTIAATVIPDLKDLRIFLETGRSPKYDAEKILGRWQFDLAHTMMLLRRSKPNLPSTEMQKLRRGITAIFSKAIVVATPDHQAILKNVPRSMIAGGAAATDAQSIQGEWKGADGKYLFAVPGGKDLIANIENDHLTVTGEGLEVAFSRED